MGRKSKSESRKPEILHNLYKVVNREGLEGTTLKKVAKEMGVNSGLLVHYYKTKDEMIFALVEFMAEKYSSIYSDKLNEFDKPKDRMDNLLNTFFEFEWSKRGDSAVFWSCYSLIYRNERVKVQFREMYLGFREQLAGEIELYQWAGITKVTDPVETADVILSMIEGIYFYHKTLGPNTNIDGAIKFIKNSVKRLLIEGI